MKRTDENHSFSIHIATALKGNVKKAILLKEIYGWVHLNGLKNKNVRHGIVWTYMSGENFAEKFPYMDRRSITRWLKDLENEKWLYSSNFNKKAYDKTKWYTINSKRYDDVILKTLHTIGQNDQWVGQIDQWISQNDQWVGQIDQPIPTTKQLLKKDNNNSIGEKDKIKDLERELKEVKDLLSKNQEKPKTKRKIFIAPTLEAAKVFFKEKESTDQEAEKFWYFYESKGWKVGKNKMVKWRASAGQWIGRNKPKAKVVVVDRISEAEQKTMFDLFCKHYRQIYEKRYIAKMSYNMAIEKVEKEIQDLQPSKNDTYTSIMINLKNTSPNLYSKAYHDYKKL